MKYSDLVVEWLEAEGYTHCFFVAGGNIMHLLDGVRRRLTCIPFVHEVAAGIAAEYFNEASDRPKAFVARHRRARAHQPRDRARRRVPREPGTARARRSGETGRPRHRRCPPARHPGDRRRRDRGPGDAALGPASNSRYRSTSSSITCAPACRRRPGPVFLELCLDAQGAVVDRADLETERVARGRAALDRRGRRRGGGARRSSRRSARSSRPVLLIGGGVSRRVATALERDLATWGVPVMTTWNGADRLDTDHPAYFGRPNTWGQRSSNVLLQQADLVIALGTRLGLQQTGFNWQQFAPLAVVAQVDIDEAELTKGHPRVDLAVRRRRRRRAREARAVGAARDPRVVGVLPGSAPAAAARGSRATSRGPATSTRSISSPSSRSSARPTT